MMNKPFKKESMSAVDTAWLRMERSTNPMMVNSIMTFEDPVTYEKIADLITERLLKFDRFTQKARLANSWTGAYEWVTDKTFDLANHLIPYSLEEDTEPALQHLVSELMSTPLNFDLPLWQFHLVENYQGGSAVICRLHHAMADGKALVRVLLSMTDETPISKLPSKGESSQSLLQIPKFVSKTWRKLDSTVRETMSFVSNPGKIFDAAKLTADGANSLARLTLRLPDPKTRLKGDLSTKKLARWSQPLPLSFVKETAKSYGATINDLLLSAVTGAIRRYLFEKQDSTEMLNIRAAIPVDIRGNEKDIELGNKFGLVFLSLPVGIDDPNKRIKVLKKRMDELKTSTEAVMAFAILNVMGLATKEIEELVIKIIGDKATAVMSNVPGPREPLYLADSKIRSMMFWVPQSGDLALGISIYSYNQEVWLGVATDESIIPDPELLLLFFEAELEDLAAEEYDTQRCAAKTLQGTRCKNVASEGTNFCTIHHNKM